MNTIVNVKLTHQQWHSAIPQPLASSVAEHARFIGRKALLRMPLSDSRIIDVIRYLRRAGLSPRLPFSGPREELREYDLHLERHYCRDDLHSAVLLRIRPFTSFDIHRRDHDGHLVVSPYMLDRGASIAGASSGTSWTVVSEHVRSLLHASDLRGINFRPTQLAASERLDSPASNWPSPSDAFWELATAELLPSMAPWMFPTVPIHNAKWVPEPYYQIQSYRFRKSDIILPLPSDLYHAPALFGVTDSEKNQMLVCSNRFAQVLLDLDIRCDFDLVHLDPDSGPEGGPLPHYPPELLEFLTPPSG